jgi:hypothetical protein
LIRSLLIPSKRSRGLTAWRQLLRNYGAIDDSAGNGKGDYRTGTGGALDREFAHDADSALAHALQSEVPKLATMRNTGIDA